MPTLKLVSIAIPNAASVKDPTSGLSVRLGASVEVDDATAKRLTSPGQCFDFELVTEPSAAQAAADTAKAAADAAELAAAKLEVEAAATAAAVLSAVPVPPAPAATTVAPVAPAVSSASGEVASA